MIFLLKKRLIFVNVKNLPKKENKKKDLKKKQKSLKFTQKLTVRMPIKNCLFYRKNCYF